MNRRGFIGALSGLVAWAKKPFLVSPAASAIPPTCEKPYSCEVRFITRDGRSIEPSPVLRVTEMDESTNTIWLEGAVPGDMVGRTIVMSPYRASGNAFLWIGRSGARRAG